MMKHLFFTMLLVSSLLSTAAGQVPKAASRAVKVQEAPQVPSNDREPRVALVIGNSAYRDARLANPVNDARAMAEALRKCGFSVTKLEDANRLQMREAIRNFGTRIAEGGVGLFYFAGHGMQVKGRNFLIPIAADIAQEDEVEGEAVEVDAVLAKMETARNRLNILILDACRNNPFGRSSRGGPQGLAQMDAPTGTYVAFATAPGKTAADGSGANGLYTAALLRQLRVQGLKLEDVFKRTRAEVLQASQRTQTPWENSSIIGDFFFTPGASQAAATAAAPTELPPPPSAKILVGGLQVAVNADHSQVYVDGALAGTATPTSALNIRDLPAGTVQVRVEAPGYAPGQKDIVIEPGRWTQAEIRLAKTAAPLPPSPSPPLYTSPVAPMAAPSGGRTKAGSVYGSVRFRLFSPLSSLDWEHTTNLRDMKVWHQIFEGLYGMDESKNGYYLELAKRISVSQDGMVYTIDLQSGVKFQNGEPLRASDVVFSYRRAMQNPRFNYLTSKIIGVAAVNDGTVRITLNRPYAPIAHTFFSVKIVSEKEVTSQGDRFGTIPHKAGTGPYYVSEYNPATGVKLEAFKDYWGGAPAIKAVEYIVIPDDTSAVVAFQNGELDYLEDVTLAAWQDVARAAGNHAKLVKGNNIMFMAVNYLSPAHKALANLKVRQAIFYAINKHDINLAICNGYGTETSQYMPPEYVPTAPTNGFKTYGYDPGMARRLLAEAGYPAGVDVGTIMTYGAPTSNNGKMAQVLQANLASIGISASVKLAEAAVIVPRLYNQDYDICVFADSSNYDFDNIRQQVHSESRGMYVVKYQGGPFDWQKIEGLIDQGAASLDIAKRRGIYTQLWSMVMDTATLLPCLHRPIGIVWSRNLDIGQPVPTYYKIRSFTLG